SLYHMQHSGIIAIEVEDFDSKIKAGSIEWSRSAKPGASANASMVTNPDVGVLKRGKTGSPQMNYRVQFKEKGTYTVWLRGWGDTIGNEGKSDSAHVGLNGNLSSAAAIQHFPPAWQWSNKTGAGAAATLEVPTAGEHTVNIWMREDGLFLDRLILAKDSTYTPNDDGPTTSGTGTTTPVTNIIQPILDAPANNTNEPDSQSVPANSNNTTNMAFVSVELENFATNTVTPSHLWSEMAVPGASGRAMKASPNSGRLNSSAEGSASMNYPVWFTESGAYLVWLRGWGDSNTAGRNDSVHVSLNGNYNNAQVLENFSNQWTWSNQKRGGGSVIVNVPTAGIHHVNLSMREDGLVLDKLILTKDTAMIPVGKAPGQTAQTTDNDSAAVSNNNSVHASISESAAIPPHVTDGYSDDTNIIVESSLTSENAIISLEIESFDTTTGAGNIQWVRSTKAGASGEASMVTSSDTGALKKGTQGSPVMNYKVFFKQAGTYTVWLRGFGDTVGNEGKSDSVHVGINGTLGSAASIQDFPAKWQWSNQKRTSGSATLLVPSTGVHTINIWMREDGLYLDKLVLVQDPAFTPTGYGPPSAH
ncbi:MAG: hypothetical protein AAF404_18755, partial [Pseudomonadota bacterium]